MNCDKMFNEIKKIIFILIFCLVLGGRGLAPVLAIEIKIDNEEIKKIQEEIQTKEDNIKNLDNQKEIYEEKIKIKRADASNLQEELSLLNNKINKREIEIETQEEKIKKADLSIKKIQLEILKKRKKIEKTKDDLKELLITINEYDQKNYLEVIFLNASLSNVFNHLRYLNVMQGKVSRNLQRIATVKEGLELQENDLRHERQNIINLKTELNGQKIQLTSEQEINQLLLKETRGAEWKFQSLLAEIITEQQNTENEIIRLEKQAREKIAAEKEKRAEDMEKEGIIVFSWPVPFEKVTCSFHDPDYPFKNWIGEHSGTDMRATQGTLVRASASGYIARAKSGGVGQYSYIMIIHNNSFSTVYGHMSKVLVKENQYVKRGEVIGWSGGMPGTPGAGRFCTGPHLHFEVRLNGIPVNPEDYLL